MEKQELKNAEKSVLGTDNKDYSKNEELIKRIDIKGTPFTVVTIENQSFGTMGGYRITEPMKSEKMVKEELKKITWNRIVQVMMILNETIKK